VKVTNEDYYDKAPPRWPTALLKPRFEKVLKMVVTAEVLSGTKWEFAPMPKPLKHAIEDIVSRR
jgi:hypothetical protein